jgi:predicted acylesterase/phospholipase RssA
MGFLTRLLAVGAAALSVVTGTVFEAPAAAPVKVGGTCQVLALSGGGAFGAVQMGVLDGLVATGQAPTSYDIITGISAGGLNAAFLSYYTNVSQALPDIYGILAGLTNADVYESAILKILTEWSYYNTAPLDATLTAVLSVKQPPAVGGPMTLIGASNVLTHQLDVWHFDRMVLADRVPVLMATSAIPLVFPPQTINGSLYVDGGVISNELIHQAMGQLACDSYNVVFVSAGDNTQTARPMPTGLFSYVGAVVSLLTDTFDYQLAQVTNCSYPRGTLQACFPTSPSLGNYSILDFDYGAELYALGRESFACQKLPLC